MAGHINGAPQLSWYNIMVTVGVVLTAAGASWTLFQSQLGALERQLTLTDTVLAKEIEEIRGMSARLRDDSIHRSEHSEVVKRYDAEIKSLIDRLSVLETTRPTTGELQGIASSNLREVSEIKERIRSLENNLRREPPSQNRPQ